jgi:hypothetical protein
MPFLPSNRAASFPHSPPPLPSSSEVARAPPSGQGGPPEPLGAAQLIALAGGALEHPPPAR